MLDNLHRIIKSKEDYFHFIDSDKRSQKWEHTLFSLWLDDVWRFQRLMRKLEYLTNCSRGQFRRRLCALRYHRLKVRLGFSIPINTFGPGLSIAHYGSIIVNKFASIGSNCRIHSGVNIGSSRDSDDAAPIIGDNCYLGPGAKVFGKIILGNNIIVGANAVVNQSFPDGNATLVGVPARPVTK